MTNKNHLLPNTQAKKLHIIIDASPKITYSTVISTRLFLALPASVAFVATGLEEP